MSTAPDFHFRPTLPAELSDYAEPPLKVGEATDLNFAELRKEFASERDWLNFLEDLKRQRAAL